MGLAKNKLAGTDIKTMKMFYKKYGNKDHLYKIIFDPNYISLTCWCLLIFEIVLNAFIIERIKYTEIDWIAYMQEVEGFLNGTLDYKYLKGDTGPLVYPAGFVYIYTLLYYITSHGQNIYLAQYIFLGIYLLQLYFTFEIFKKTCKIPPYALILSTITSYRIHSIYVLRLFNDPIAVLFFYISLNAFLQNKWYLGSIFFSLAVSVKMNILLYAPCLLIAYLTNLTYFQTFYNLLICGVIQIILGAPFLYGNFISYINGSFDFGRIFEHKWTVNYRFLVQDIFESKAFHISLLCLHVTLLIIFLPYLKKYLSSYSKLNSVIKDLKAVDNKQSQKEMKLKKVGNPSKKQEKTIRNREKLTKSHTNKKEEKLSRDQTKFLENFEKSLKNTNPKQKNNEEINETESTNKDTFEINFSKLTQLFVLPFFVTNLIGITCARSLHYQFYCWYFNSLIYLIHCTTYRKSVMYLMLGIIEFCWNTYPSTNVSSALLHLCHIVLLFGVYKYMRE